MVPPPPPHSPSPLVEPPRPENLLHVRTPKLTLGCPILDRLLHGGVPCGSVTELVAESGTGKTQLCLQLLLCALLPTSLGGLSSASLYIHSEFPFPLRRLLQLSCSQSNSLDHILVRGVHTADELLALLAQTDALLVQSPTSLPIRLVVLDSVAALFRSDFDNTPRELKRRSALFFRIASKLKEQARRFGSVVVVTNHVVDVLSGDMGSGCSSGSAGGGGGGGGNSMWTSGRRVAPALGLSWANCVNSRIFLSKSEEVVGMEERVDDGCAVTATRRTTRRRMQVVFAPHLPESSCEFVILREGVFGVA